MYSGPQAPLALTSWEALRATMTTSPMSWWSWNPEEGPGMLFWLIVILTQLPTHQVRTWFFVILKLSEPRKRNSKLLGQLWGTVFLNKPIFIVMKDRVIRIISFILRSNPLLVSQVLYFLNMRPGAQWQDIDSFFISVTSMCPQVLGLTSVTSGIYSTRWYTRLGGYKGKKEGFLCSRHAGFEGHLS